MLLELRVRNLALIDSLLLELSEEGGLVAFTGETGAGKSIILQAIHLLTGGRASTTWIRDECERAVIEACFSIRKTHEEALELLRRHDLDQGEECLIRRVVARNGRSRMYINDQQVTVRVAAELTGHLLSIASQHEHQRLLQVGNHLDFLDSYGELWDRRKKFADLFARYRHLVIELEDLRKKEQEREQRRDFLAFQLEEIRTVNPVAGEDEALARERDRLKASETLVQLVRRSQGLLRDELLGQLAEIRKNMEQAASLDPELAGLSDRIVSACFEIEDLEGELLSYAEALPRDQSRLEGIQDRLASLRQLQRKYGTTLEEVLAFAEEAASELSSLENLDQEIADRENRIADLYRSVEEHARELSELRRQAAKRLARAMQEELRSLNFIQAEFVVHFHSAGPDTYSSTGCDQVEFLFSANPGEPPKPLVQVVSGGELSRLMLAMRCLLARRDRVDTVIFDEVDAGIGGQTAEAVAEKISELAGHHQVLCITHLPQIAASARKHFLVEKVVEQGRTSTVIRPLDKEQRVEELARMLAGDDPSDQTFLYARELIARKRRAHE